MLEFCVWVVSETKTDFDWLILPIKFEMIIVLQRSFVENKTILLQTSMLENETNSNTGDREWHHKHEWYRS